MYKAFEDARDRACMPDSRSRRNSTRYHVSARAFLPLLAVTLTSVLAGPQTPDVTAQQTSSAQTYALLLNGGGKPATNYLSHLHHLQDMMAALRIRGIAPERITVFSADGADPGNDMAVRENAPDDFWLLDGTDAGRALNATEMTNTAWSGVTIRPARLGELRQWFASMGDVLQPGDTLLVFVTDHGTRNKDDPDNGFITLWNESLSVLEFRALLGYLKPGVRVVSVMSQCFSGAFAEAMIPLHSHLPDGNVCGFYSTTSDRMAYGCYPEATDRDRIGHAFRFIDAMDRHASLDDVHATVVVTDTSPDVPVRTSDLFLERLLKDQASLRKVGIEELVDAELALAWKNHGQWEPYLRLLDRIGEVYGTFSPRSLSELKPGIERLQSLSTELATYEHRWKLALDDLRKSNLARFLKESQAWKERLDQTKLTGLDPAGRRGTLAELLPALKDSTKARPDIWTRLEDLHKTDGDAKSAKYRIDVRLAALMRMRALLVRVAGLQLFAQGTTPTEDMAPGESRLAKMRSALAGLEECESSVIGTLDPSKEKPVALEAQEPLPPFDEDLATVSRALPSWLGINYRPVPDRQRESLGVEPGAAMIDQLYQDGPAAAAGLKPGDIVVGPPRGYFTQPNQIREWTITSPRNTPLALDILRSGKKLRVTVSLAPYPIQLPELSVALKAGDKVPSLGSLTLLRSGSQIDADFSKRRHMLFFWATWCPHCKSSLPELMAWSTKTGVPVLAVSDEDEQTIRKFLDSWKGPFPNLVTSDGERKIHRSYGVSGTPTFVLVDEQGRIEWRQAGYSAENQGLTIPGWSWHGHVE